MHQKDVDRFWSKVHKTEFCWNWTASKSSKGYGGFFLRGRSVGAHRVSWEIHSGSPVQEGLCVLHACDNPQCVRPEHLFLGTNDDNVQDKVRKGRQSRAKVGAKLTVDLVHTVREMRAAGKTLSEIAKVVGISLGGVSKITVGRTWRDVSAREHKDA